MEEALRPCACYDVSCPSFQNDHYTIGGTEMFDTLTDLVEYYKRKGIEEMSGKWVQFKQVNRESKLKKKKKNEAR